MLLQLWRHLVVNRAQMAKPRQLRNRYAGSEQQIGAKTGTRSPHIFVKQRFIILKDFDNNLSVRMQ